MSCRSLRCPLLTLLFLGSLAIQAGQAPQTALEKAPAGWVDLMPGKALQGWTRVVLPPDVKLNPKNPWALSADGQTLRCDGIGVKEMFLHDREFGDGIFHVEWRFRKTPEKVGYNGGVYVRTSADGKVWHQAQVAHLDKPPLMADLFGETRVGTEIKKFQVLGKGHQLARPVGEWNTYEVTARGKTITVHVNGTLATTWDDCQVPKGRVVLQAEFWFLEFRNLKYRSLHQPPGGEGK